MTMTIKLKMHQLLKLVQLEEVKSIPELETLDFIEYPKFAHNEFNRNQIKKLCKIMTNLILPFCSLCIQSQ